MAGKAITVRVPASLKRRLEAAARSARRSVSAEIVHCLDQSLAERERVATRPARSPIGRFVGAKIPSDKDFRGVRAILWGRLGRSS